MSKYVAAIDLGTTKVATIVGEKSAGGIKIIAYSEFPSNGIKRGEVINIQKVLNALTPTIDSVNRQIEDEEFNLEEVYVGIAGQAIRCTSASNKKIRMFPHDIITENEVSGWTREMYNYSVNPGEKVLHVIPQSYNVDEHMYVSEAAGMIGKDIEAFFRLFVGRANAVKSCAEVIHRKGLKIQRMLLEPIASARAVITEEDMELGVAVVDIGGGTSDILIIEDNIVRHTAVIPFGGNSITEDIRQVCGVSFKDAEILKKQHGSCLSEYAQESKVINIPGRDGSTSKQISFKLLASVIEARVSEILATVAYEIEQSGFKGKLRSGVVITGGSSRINHIQILAKHILETEVRLAQPDTFCLMSTSVEEVFRPSCSTAVGLILKGFDVMDGIDMDTLSIPAPSVPKDEVVETNIFGEERTISTAPEDQKGNKQKTAPAKPKKKFKDLFKGKIGEIGDIFGTVDADDEA